MYMELFYAIISTLFSCFADLLCLHVVTFLMVFSLFMSCFSSRCMLELKFAIFHRAASLSSQASSVDVLYL